ncbi:hypothetical protein CDV36_007127 [Fusarium kuroshium]|uniref:SPX domain-containing protein n=1 Tax=Fusarium kuroshium TaxID=2010991 RepID=A0A3M2S7W1_9HYPO|nr:hypothetical protein CDV36_007127 [Fusarium kuroshium]
MSYAIGQSHTRHLELINKRLKGNPTYFDLRTTYSPYYYRREYNSTRRAVPAVSSAQFAPPPLATHTPPTSRACLWSFSSLSSPTTQDLKTRSKTWTSTRSGKRIPTVRPGVVVMKFGEQLRSSVIHEYQWYYIDYDGLKDELKHPTGPIKLGSKGPEWTEDDETRFVGKLEAELEKVHTKQQVKAMEISRRIAVSEREVKEVVNRLNERGLDENGPSEEEFMLLEEDLSDIIADVHDLAKFVQLNYTGFYKIIKKHDVSCPR